MIIAPAPRRGAVQLRQRMVRAQRGPAAAPAACRRTCRWSTASSISPSGMQLAGKYGIGVLSIASNSTEGIQALPTQWGFAEEAAAQHGQTVDRKNWRVMMAFHLAETKRAGAQRGRRRAAALAQRVQRLDARAARTPPPSTTRGSCSTQTTGDGAVGAGAAVVGTPDDLVAGDPPPPGDHRRFRCRARLRPRLGEPRGDAAVVGPGRPLRDPRDQRHDRRHPRIAGVPPRQPGRADGRRHRRPS